MVRPLGFTPDPLAAGRIGKAKKVTVTSSAAVELIGSSSAQVGCVVRVISNSGSQLTMGDSNITADASTSPGALVIMGAGSGLSINFSGALYGRTDSGTAVVAVAPILADGLSIPTG